MTDDSWCRQRTHRRHHSADGRTTERTTDSGVLDISTSRCPDRGRRSQRSTPRRRRRNSGELSLSIQGFEASGESVYDDENDHIPVKDIGLDASWLECSTYAVVRRKILHSPGGQSAEEDREEERSDESAEDREEERGQVREEDSTGTDLCSENGEESQEEDEQELSRNNNSTSTHSVTRNKSASKNNNSFSGNNDCISGNNNASKKKSSVSRNNNSAYKNNNSISRSKSLSRGYHSVTRVNKPQGKTYSVTRDANSETRNSSSVPRDTSVYGREAETPDRKTRIGPARVSFDRSVNAQHQQQQTRACNKEPAGAQRTGGAGAHAQKNPYALQITPHNVDALLIGARFFKQSDTISKCKETLLDCNVENALYYKYVADKHELEDIRPYLHDYVRAHFTAISRTNSFLGMGVQQCILLLSDSALKVDRELDVFLAARGWLEHSKNERRKHVAEVMSCVRFLHISAEEIARIVEPQDPFFRGAEGRELLLTVYRFHALHGNRGASKAGLVVKSPPPRKYVPLGAGWPPAPGLSGAFPGPVTPVAGTANRVPAGPHVATPQNKGSNSLQHIPRTSQGQGHPATVKAGAGGIRSFREWRGPADWRHPQAGDPSAGSQLPGFQAPVQQDSSQGFQRVLKMTPFNADLTLSAQSTAARGGHPQMTGYVASEGAPCTNPIPPDNYLSLGDTDRLTFSSAGAVSGYLHAAETSNPTNMPFATSTTTAESSNFKGMTFAGQSQNTLDAPPRISGVCWRDPTNAPDGGSQPRCNVPTDTTTREFQAELEATSNTLPATSPYHGQTNAIPRGFSPSAVSKDQEGQPMNHGRKAPGYGREQIAPQSDSTRDGDNGRSPSQLEQLRETPTITDSKRQRTYPVSRTSDSFSQTTTSDSSQGFEGYPTMDSESESRPVFKGPVRVDGSVWREPSSTSESPHVHHVEAGDRTLRDYRQPASRVILGARAREMSTTTDSSADLERHSTYDTRFQEEPHVQEVCMGSTDIHGVTRRYNANKDSAQFSADPLETSRDSAGTPQGPGVSRETRRRGNPETAVPQQLVHNKMSWPPMQADTVSGTSHKAIGYRQYAAHDDAYSKTAVTRKSVSEAITSFEEGERSRRRQTASSNEPGTSSFGRGWRDRSASALPAEERRFGNAAGNNSRLASELTGRPRSRSTGLADYSKKKQANFGFLRYYQDPDNAEKHPADDSRYAPCVYKAHPYSAAGQPPPLPIPPRVSTVLAIGGLNPSSVDENVPCRMVEQFHPHHNDWSLLTKLPEPRHHHACVVMDDFLFLIGGSVVDRSDPYDLAVPTNQCYRYDPVGNYWTEIAPMKHTRMYHGLAQLEGVLYALGGQTDDDRFLATVEYYNADTDEWGHTASMFDSIIGVAAIGFHGLVYVMGGFMEKDDDNIVLGTVECYDPRRNCWMTKNPLPGPRCHACVVEVAGSLYLLGGATLVHESEAVVSLASVLRYDESEDSWGQFDMLFTPRHDAGCCVLGNRIFVVGGVCSITKDVLADVECLDVAGRYWLDNIKPLSGPALGLACVTVPGDMRRQEP